jgi:hypothetical protein
VSTFGQFHTWNSNDPIKERALVYASFPSPQLVPRDVVFGKFGTVGGVRESWTAPVYILSADFAEVLPADEDQMPLDGNPHPFPGELQPNNNLFVNPQYPEVGWDVVQDGNDAHQGNQQGNAEPHQHDEVEEVEEVPESMVLSMSEDSGSSVNMQEVMPHLQAQNQVLNVGMVITRFGPVLPPDMQWEKVLSRMVPSLYFCTIPVACKESQFTLLALNKLPSSWVLSGIQGKKLVKVNGGIGVLAWQEEHKYSLWGEYRENQRGTEEGIAVTATPTVSKKRGTRSKVKAQLVQSEERRFTRSCLKEGYKPKPVLSVQPKIKKKARAKLLIQNAEKEEEESSQAKDDTEVLEETYPVTPVHVLQRVGLSLGIAPSKLTQEQLEAEAKKEGKSSSGND